MAHAERNSGPGPLSKTRLQILLIVLFGLAAYSNTFEVPFYFDDFTIIENLRVRDVSNIPSMFIEIGGPNATRPLMYATFALNYFLGGFNTWGYHAVNLFLHLLSGVLLYRLVMSTGRILGHRQQDTAAMAALASLLFVLHPVQTETVTYIVSRSMLLATVFYLSGILLFIRAVTAEKRKTLYTGGLFLVSMLGIASREDFVTFPVMLILYDFFFVSRFRLREVAGHFRTHLPVILSLAYLAYLMINNTYGIGVGFDVEEAGPFEYLMTQFNVHWKYLGLLVLPINQNLDYDYPVARTLFELPTIISFLGYAALWAVGILSARKRAVVSFCILWFLITLAPTSSIIPIDDVIFEHRLYLPSAGFFVLAAAGSVRLSEALTPRLPALGRAAVPALVTVALIFGAAAYTRNGVWANGMALWEDVIEKSPKKARGYSNLALHHAKLGNLDKALELYETAVEMDPDDEKIHSNLGTIYAKKGAHDKAIEQFKAALKLKPDYTDAHYNLANAYRKEQPALAIAHYMVALQINPEFVPAHNNLGTLYMRFGQPGKAIEHFKKAVSIWPDFASGYYNLGNARAKLGQIEMALENYRKALHFRPEHVGAHNNAGDLYAASGRTEKAVEHYTAALLIDSSRQDIRRKLELIRLAPLLDASKGNAP